MSEQDRECYTFVNVEAYALAKCAQKTISLIEEFDKNQQKTLKTKLSQKIGEMIEKL